MSGEFNSRKYSKSTKFKWRHQIFVILSFMDIFVISCNVFTYSVSDHFKMGETILGKSPGAERWMRFLRLEAIFYVQFFNLFTKIFKHFHSNLVLKYLVLFFWKITSHIFYSYTFSYPDVSHLYSTKTWSGNPVTTNRKKRALFYRFSLT